MFYLHSSLDAAYHVSMGIYKLLSLASMPQNDIFVNAEMLYVLNQWNESIKEGLVMWLLTFCCHGKQLDWNSDTF